MTARLAKTYPESRDRQVALAATHLTLGDVFLAQKDTIAALGSYEASLAIAQQFALREDGDPRWRNEMAKTYDRLARVAQARGDLATASRQARMALDLRQRLLNLAPANLDRRSAVAVSQRQIGDLEQARGDATAALESYRASMAVYQRLATENPDTTLNDLAVAVLCIRIGTLKGSVLSTDDRLALLRRAQTILRGLKNDRHLPASMEDDRFVSVSISSSLERVEDLIRGLATASR